MWYGADEVMILLECKQTYAYRVIKQLSTELAEKGYISPPAGKIQKSYFCERYNLSQNECDKLINEYKKGA